MKPNLTQRQLEVRHLLEQGFSNKEVAQKLGIAAGTVKNYRNLLGLGEPGATLSKRERQVANLVKLGFMDSEIGEKLGLSVNTVGAYRQKLLHKVGARNATHLSTLLSQTEELKLLAKIEELELLVTTLKGELRLERRRREQ
jgi:DNA-binding NarL/FixJ family response regulator